MRCVTDPMRKSTTLLVAGKLQLYILDSEMEHTDKRFISAGAKTPNSTALMNSRGRRARSVSGDCIAHSLQTIGSQLPSVRWASCLA